MRPARNLGPDLNRRQTTVFCYHREAGLALIIVPAGRGRSAQRTLREHRDL
jgi:hypothetical protein